MMTMMAMMPTSAAIPAKGPTSSRTIWPSDLPPRRTEQEEHHAVVHRAAKHRPDQDPQQPRQIAKLRRQDGPDERARPGDRRKVVPEYDPAMRGDVIPAVGMDRRGRGAQLVEREHLRHQPRGMESIGDGKRAEGRDHHPHRVDRLAARQGEDADGRGPEGGDRAPAEEAQRTKGDGGAHTRIIGFARFRRGGQAAKRRAFGLVPRFRREKLQLCWRRVMTPL